MDISLLGVRSEEDRRSKEADLIAKPEPFENTVVGVAWTVPIVKGIDFQGEWTYSESLHQTDRIPDIAGNGTIAGLNARLPWGLRAEGSYMYLSPNWDSYFRALSYKENRRGPRVRLEYERGRILVSLFGKYLTTINPLKFYLDRPKVKVVYPTLSARAYLTARPGLNIGLATILSGEGPEEGTLTLDTANMRTTLLAAITYEFGKDSSITLEERYVMHRFAEDDDYRVSMLALYAQAAIW